MWSTSTRGAFLATALLVGLASCAVDKVKFQEEAKEQIDLVVSSTKLAVLEGEDTTFTVALSARPEVEVLVTLRSSSEEKLQGAPVELRFAPEAFDAPQVVTVTGQTDRDAVNEEVSLTVESDGLAPVTVDVSVIECPTLAAQDFWVMFNPNNTAQGRRDIHVAGPAGTMVTVADAAAVEIPANGLLTVDTGLTRVPTPNVVESGKAFPISATAPVQVFANNFNVFTVDAFTAVPVQLLGTDYRAIGYSTSSQAQIGVYATEDNTAVTIGAVPPINITLNRGQSYLRVASGDITGMRIVSDKPVGVNTGDACINTGAGACDHVEEMLFPVGSWASDYYVPNLPQQQVVRVVAAADDTVVNVDGVQVATLAAGAFHAINGGGMRIQTSKPAQAYLIVLGESTSGDPSFVLLPGVQNAVDASTFSAFAEDNVNTVALALPTAAIASVRLDGAVLGPNVTWTAYPGGEYSHAQIVIAAGLHKLTADAPFIPVIWGEKNSESYAYVAGYGYPKATCQLP